MKNIIITCDRCKKNIKGMVDEATEMTAGYYDVVSKYWNQFGNLGERYVCDSCMMSDPKYIRIYGCGIKIT